MPHGTSFGPLLNHTRLQNAAFFQMRAVEAVKNNLSVERKPWGKGGEVRDGEGHVKGEDQPIHNCLNPTLPTLADLSKEEIKEVSEKLDDVAENESLISLHCNLTRLLKRKEYLLSTLETLKEIEGRTSVEVLTSDEYVHHKNWVVTNLTVTNRYLTVGIGLLQRLYSRLYTGTSPNDLTDAEAKGVVKALLEKRLIKSWTVPMDERVASASMDVYVNAFLEVEMDGGGDVDREKGEKEKVSRFAGYFFA